MKKLLIWDFDGVIADTEHIAMNMWQNALIKYGINWSFEETVKNIMGKGQKAQFALLQQYNKQITFDDVKNDIHNAVNLAIQKNINLTNGVEDIFNIQNFAQCIATGNAPEGIKARVEPLGLNRYFSQEQLFSANLVKRGKPEPDLFLYAADKMGFEPKNCIVIEDSLTGLTAGLRAKMLTLAFVEHAVLEKDKYVEDIKALRINNIFENMKELKAFLSGL